MTSLKIEAIPKGCAFEFEQNRGVATTKIEQKSTKMRENRELNMQLLPFVCKTKGQIVALVNASSPPPRETGGL